MTQFYFRIRQGRFAGAANHAIELPDRDAAWHELALVCGDIVSGVTRDIKQDDEWQMELLDPRCGGDARPSASGKQFAGGIARTELMAARCGCG
jgi:hypothetical protein